MLLSIFRQEANPTSNNEVRTVFSAVQTFVSNDFFIDKAAGWILRGHSEKRYLSSDLGE